MITNIWLKVQPKKKIPYPDCFPVFTIPRPGSETHDFVRILDIQDRAFGTYLLSQIARIEFRP